MKKIEILCTGCAKCRQLTAVAESAARDLGLDYELVKVTALEEILARGVMRTPALVVDGALKAVGRVPSAAELRSLLV